MASFTGYLAQCIEVGKKVIVDAGVTYVTPGTSVCGPFPTANVTPNAIRCPTNNCFDTPGDVISRIMEYAFPFAGIIVFFVFVSAGYDYLMSQGEASKLESANKKILAGLIGFGLLLVSYVVVKTVSYILGFDSPV